MRFSKKSILLISALFFCGSLFAQEEFNAVFQKKDAASYRGKKFRFEGAVKVMDADKSSSAALWARVDNTNGKVGFFDNMNKRPVRSNEWKTYRIEGVVDSNAKFINIGGLYSGNGKFCFDNMNFEVLNAAGEWEKISLNNTGFENDSLGDWKMMRKVKYFTNEIVTGNAFEGNKYFMGIGSGMEKPYGDNDSTGHYVKANGIKIYYEEYGSGQPLLMLHGNSQSISAFSKQIPELSKYYRVIAVDTRGHGKTEIKGKRYSYDLFAEDMNAFLDKLKIDSADIVGWSDGGNTGLIMAMKYPKKVKKLITMGAVIFCDSTAVSQGLIEELHFGIEEMKNAKTKDELNDLKKTKLLLEEPNYKFSDLKVIKCPVLVVAGEKDLIKYGHTKGIADAIPGAEMYIAPKYSHYFPQENAALFNKTVLSFLQK